MGVPGNLNFGGSDLHPPGHAQVDNPLAMFGLPATLASGPLQIEHDVLADAANLHNTGMFQHASNLVGRGFKRLGLLTQPNRLDGVARYPHVQSACNCFYFRQFGHEKTVYGKVTCRPGS